MKKLSCIATPPSLYYHIDHEGSLVYYCHLFVLQYGPFTYNIDILLLGLVLGHSLLGAPGVPLGLPLHILAWPVSVDISNGGMFEKSVESQLIVIHRLVNLVADR